MDDNHAKISCGICANKINPSRKKSLYEHPVCSKCYYAFAIRRQIGFLIDALLYTIILAAIAFIIGGIILLIIGNNILDFKSRDAEKMFALILFLVFCMKDGIMGYSPGKYIMGLRVLDRTSKKPIGIIASLKRNTPFIITCIPIIVIFTLYKGSRLGDKWANTYVIWNKYKDKLPFATPSFTASDIPWKP